MAQPKFKKSEKKTGKRIVIGFLMLLLLLLGTAWAFGWIGRTNPALAEVQELQAKLSDPALKDQDRRAIWGQMRDKMGSLSQGDRDSAREAMRARFEQRMNDHIKQLLAMSDADRLKALDADIDRMEKMQAQRAADQKNAAADGKDGKDGGKDGTGRGRNRQANRQGYTPDDQRISRLKNRLDRGTPETRALRTQYQQMLNQRMQQRGLPPITRRWG